MELLTCFAALLFLVVSPLAAGLLAELLAGEKNIPGLFPTGVILFLTCFQILYLTAFYGGGTLPQLARSLAVLGCVYLLALILCLFSGKKRKGLSLELRRIAEQIRQNKSILFTAMGLYLLLLLLILSQHDAATGAMYRCGEQTALLVTDGGQTTLRELAGIDPVTGEQQAESAAAKGGMMPALYAAICELTGLSNLTVLGLVAPMWVLAIAFSVCCQVTGSFQKERNSWPVIFFALAALFAGSAYRNPFFDLMHLPYEPATLTAFLLLPVVFLVCKEREKKSIRSLGVAAAVLLAEAFLAYGLGGLYGGVVPLMAAFVLWEITRWISWRFF